MKSQWQSLAVNVNMSVSIHVSSKNFNVQHNMKEERNCFQCQIQCNLLLPSQGYLVDVERAI